MSVGPNPNELLEQARRQINRLAEEIARLSEMELEPGAFYGEFLQRVLTAIAAPAGAIWLRTPQGNLQLQYQINMREVGLDRDDQARESHFELLRQAALRGQPGLLAPHSGLGVPEGGGPAAGNPTDYVILLAPILIEKQVAGLVEIWQDPNRGADAQRGFLQFLVRMAGLAGVFARNQTMRQMVGQQQVWTQLEAFARQVHATLNPTEVSYLIANEGRRLVECDRVNVALRYGQRYVIEAISGADIVEKRSNLVQLMRALVKSVMEWGEKLVYSGIKDDTLPPKVARALDGYLAESNSKFLVLVPLKDERESESKRPARSALLMESFEPSAAPEQMVARLDVVGRHATSALYNAVEHHRIPGRFIWKPLARVQEGLGGKARAILTLVGIGLVVLIALMIFVPYPLKMDATGELLPRERIYVFSPGPGTVKEFVPGLKEGVYVTKNQELIRLLSPELEQQVGATLVKLTGLQTSMQNHKRALQTAKESERLSISSELIRLEAEYLAEKLKLDNKQRQFNLDGRHPGEFLLKSPIGGIVLTSGFREKLYGALVQPNQPLLRVGKVDPKRTKLPEWEIELKIPQKHIGQVLLAFKANEDKDLDVDLLLATRPTSVYRAKLSRAKVAPAATPDRNENNESEPVAMAWLRIHGDDIAEGDRLPLDLLVTGTQVHTRIRCGNRAMGYSLFYGVWEFIYEKIVFFF
jgi:hypothetical protein